MQQIDVSLSIPVPADSILIKKIEFQELQQERLSGVYWNMKDLEKRINKSDRWIRDNILYPERFKKQLDINNGGFVFYPERQGQTWSFQASKMATFLDKNFNRIFGR